MATLLAFAIVCFGVLILRYKQPLLHRPFKTPGAPWVPLIGTLVCVAQMCFLPMVTWLQFIGWNILGLIVYFMYSIKNSTLRQGK
jgi:APA family basic amino acid/polyamine antiporter